MLFDQTVTIPNGTATHATGLDTGLTSNHPKTQLVGITFPAAMTSTALTITAASTLDGTYTTLMEVGGAASYSVTVTASRRVPLDPRVFVCAPFIKIVTGSNEGDNRILTMHFREVS